jgi:hypothetical protein
MGMDPVTLGIGATVVGGLVGAYGKNKEQNAAKDRYNTAQQQGQSMMHTGADPYQAALMQLLGKQAAPMQVGADSGMINAQSILGNSNPGNDALMQFLRSDPSKQMSFDASKSFDMLGALDKRTQTDAMSALNQNFSGSMGQRFGSAAMRQTSDLLANLGAQTGARNAGILQQSFENQQTRGLQGSGLMLQGSTALAQNGNQMAQLAAQLAMANQGNQQWNQQFNQSNLNNAFNQQFQGIQAGFGMQNSRDDYNARLFSVMSGLPMPQGNGFTAFGDVLGQAGQMAAFLPMLQQMSRPTGTVLPTNPQAMQPSVPLSYMGPTSLMPQVPQQPRNPFLMY